MVVLQCWWKSSFYYSSIISHKKNFYRYRYFGDTCRAYRETVDNVKDILVNSRSRTWPRAELCNNHRVNSDIFDLTSGHLSLHKYVSLPWKVYSKAEEDFLMDPNQQHDLFAPTCICNVRCVQMWNLIGMYQGNVLKLMCIYTSVHHYFWCTFSF